MSGVLNKMLAELSEEDRLVFEELSKKLKQVNGDIERLSSEDIQLIQSMESKYGKAINQTHTEYQNKNEDFIQEDILDSSFAQQVRQILARDLAAKFPSEEEVVAFVFENKWLPIDCQDEKLANELYQRYEADILDANQWRNDLVDSSSDKKMALGLAWFMVVFQLNKRLN